MSDEQTPLQQKMPQGEAWQRFLSNDGNKNDLNSIS